MIRKATPGDWPSISDISRRSGYEDYINRTGSSYLEEGEVLLYEDGSIKAFSKIEYLPDNSVWFSGLRVDPDYWRSGIGQKLSEASLKFGTEKGCATARLLVYDDNTRSLGLVEKLGFRMVGKYNFIYGTPNLEDFDTVEVALDQGLINLGWKFMEASKAHPVKASLHSFNEWRILETGEKTFEILHTGKPISLSGKEGFTCARSSMNLTETVHDYAGLDISSGFVLEKALNPTPPP